MIPEAAVEAAARAHYEVSTGKQWDRLKPDRQRELLSYSHRVIEAAAPHIRAQALEESADAWQVRMDTIGRGSVEAKTFMQVRAVAERPTP